MKQIDIKERVPFKILGIDSDNGSEFINAHLLNFCQQEKITFTRTRPYSGAPIKLQILWGITKNDNCFVEQKNYSIVRRYTGYDRYDNEEELNILNQLYKTLRLYTNFFLPAMKLISKTRIGSKITKKYDIPKTPFKRVLEVSHEQQRKQRKSSKNVKDTIKSPGKGPINSPGKNINLPPKKNREEVRINCWGYICIIR